MSLAPHHRIDPVPDPRCRPGRHPAVTDDDAITGLWVTDPWYPRISSIWGPSREPNQHITVRQLREDYRKWRRPTGRYPGMDGRYVLVLPADEAA